MRPNLIKTNTKQKRIGNPEGFLSQKPRDFLTNAELVKDEAWAWAAEEEVPGSILRLRWVEREEGWKADQKLVKVSGW